jgi:hypothetical protein
MSLPLPPLLARLAHHDQLAVLLLLLVQVQVAELRS